MSEHRCDGLTRREILKLGMVAPFGLSLTDYFRLRALAPLEKADEVSCILIWLDGGPSHLDTFDPKPDAPAEIRGDFKAIATSVAGVQICEHLPRTGRIMDRVALVRSLTHDLGNHDTGSRYLLTGHRPTPALEYPSLGSLVASQVGLSHALPPYIAIPEGVPSSGGGFLPAPFNPFSVGGDPGAAGFQVRDLTPPEGVSFDRIDRRRAMLEVIDGFSGLVEGAIGMKGRDSFYEQAFRLMASPDAKAAFDLGKESQAVRSRYGHHRIGASCLLARRLIEAGTRFVTVVDTGWDHHQQIFKALPDAYFPGSGKLPRLDQAYSALIEDLESRGMLEKTLVVLMGEFGRTPKINSQGGRDHWPRAGCALLAGGGVRGGQAIGETDAHGELPKDRAVSPEDLAQTILSILGIDTSKEIVAPGGRPVKILSAGVPIHELL
jgi:hypothetical protein